MSKENSDNPVSSWSDWFNRAAKAFEDPRMKVAYYRDGETGTPYSEEAVKLTFQNIWDKLQPGSSDLVLDIGCGVGFFTQNYMDRVKKIIGTDIAPQMVQEAHKINPKGTFLACRADALSFKDSQFNCILSYGVTQYLPDMATLERMVQESVRVLKSPGKFLIGDILEPVHENSDSSYNRQSPKSKTKAWWPSTLDHSLKKLYVPRKFFEDYCAAEGLKYDIFEQEIEGRHIPTPRYDVVIKRS